MTYNCQQLADRPNIYGEYACKTWVEVSPSVLDQLAITKEDAGALALAIVSLMIMAFCGGLIGRLMLKES